MLRDKSLSQVIFCSFVVYLELYSIFTRVNLIKIWESTMLIQREKQLYRKGLILTLMAVLFVITADKIYSHAMTKKEEHLTSDIKVILYTKKGCRYCEYAKELLRDKKIPHKSIEFGDDYEFYEKMVEKTGQRTVPMIYVDGEFIGGYDDLKKLSDDGKI